MSRPREAARLDLDDASFCRPAHLGDGQAGVMAGEPILPMKLEGDALGATAGVRTADLQDLQRFGLSRVREAAATAAWSGRVGSRRRSRTMSLRPRVTLSVQLNTPRTRWASSRSS